ncbi:MAG: alpha/beta hydrolase [Verrucomicrobiota bacterium]
MNQFKKRISRKHLLGSRVLMLSLLAIHAYGDPDAKEKQGDAAIQAIGFRGQIYTPAPGVTKQTLLYKSTKQRELNMHIHFPAGWKSSDQRPVMVFFFGGGWKKGTTQQFLIQSNYFASRGIVCARPEYRLTTQEGVSIDHCVEDARSAVRWVRENADKLGIDPNEVIASGGSAGGHLAFCTSIEESLDGTTDNLDHSSIPQAMVLYNPGLFYQDTPEVQDKLMNEIGKISPLNHVTKSTPPTLILFGTKDKLKRGADEYMKLAKERGVHAELWLAPDQGHGFFNAEPWLSETNQEVDRFLTSLGYLE